VYNYVIHALVVLHRETGAGSDPNELVFGDFVKCCRLVAAEVHTSKCCSVVLQCVIQCAVVCCSVLQRILETFSTAADLL